MNRAAAVVVASQKASKKKAKKDAKTLRIDVGSLPTLTNDLDLHDYFSQFGVVKEARVLKAADAKHRGFVVFQDVGSIGNVFETEPHLFGGAPITLSWSGYVL
ncbi:unnamed protein product [Dibothriocephalus latus]|uniref:RRM domain-containing protein n=1 Tax=Dibothriocephalus latus TaxID=60516 RepID=A0A3P7MMW4_DIBLA|nr:unnamed protein product [Dibothriocephalus latus]